MRYYLTNLRLSARVLVIYTIVLVTISVLTLTKTVLAHSPLFPEENHSITTAYHIDDPAKSWATYTSLDHSDKGDYYRFRLSSGDQIVISLFTSESPTISGFLPSFALLVPDYMRRDVVPSYIEIPDNYGVIAISGTDPGIASYEPFTPGWLYETAELGMEAPNEGLYYVVVFDSGGKTGNYALPIGYLEEWTPLELLSLQYTLRQIYAWEGQNPFIAGLPIVIAMIVGSIVLYQRNRSGKAPKGLSKWLASLAGLAFIGSAADRVTQMLLSFRFTGIHGEAAITLIFVAVAIVFTVLMLRYGIRSDTYLTKRRRVALIAIGIGALFVWTGLYFGTALAIAAAVLPDRMFLEKEAGLGASPNT